MDTTGIESCPHCGVDLVIRRSQFRTTTRTQCFDVPGFGTVAWRCPDCAKLWHRWPSGHELHEIARPWVEHFGGRQG